MSRKRLLAALLLATGVVLAQDAPDAERKPAAEAPQEAKPGETPEAKPDAQPDAKPEQKADQGPKVISGMSILGNQEAPKSLVLVPWKSSELGTVHGIATMLDDSTLPVDRDVFLRALSYYEIRSETKR